MFTFEFEFDLGFITITFVYDCIEGFFYQKALRVKRQAARDYAQILLDRTNNTIKFNREAQELLFERLTPEEQAEVVKSSLEQKVAMATIREAKRQAIKQARPLPPELIKFAEDVKKNPIPISHREMNDRFYASIKQELNPLLLLLLMI